MFLSKRSELFYQDIGHLIIKAKGCEVWDLDNKKYFDMSLMAGTNVGYCNKFVDKTVNKTIKLGNMSFLLIVRKNYI